MLRQIQPSQPRNSPRINLVISLVFHAIILLALSYFAAREGLLGQQLKKIAVEMVKEKPPEKPKEKELEKPKEEPPKVEAPKVAVAPKMEPPKADAPPPATIAPPAVAPPAEEVPSFGFEGGKLVETSSNPVQIYRAFIESSVRAKWSRPEDTADIAFVADVEVTVDARGLILDPQLKKARETGDGMSL